MDDILDCLDELASATDADAFESGLRDILDASGGPFNVRTYADYGMMTHDRGLVVENTLTGAKFTLTIQPYRY